MKHPHHPTPSQAGPTLSEIGRWPLNLFHLHERLAPRFARSEPRRHALLYLQAIISDIPRKNGWQIAEHAKQARPYGMQRLLSQAVWDHEGVRDDLRVFLWQALSPPALPSPTAESAAPLAVLVLDESGFPKRGDHSAGVQPQYCGTTGRVENCQVGVFLSYVTALGHGLIDRELYLPEDWCHDPARRQAAHIPATVTFQTKPELARRMVERAQAAGLPIDWVVADTVYGHSSDLRVFLEEQGFSYALAVPCTEVVCVQTQAGCLLSDVASIAHHALCAQDWQRLSQSQGTKGERLFDWAILPWFHRGTVDGRHFLVFRRCLDDPHELAYYLVFAPLATTLSTIVQAIGARWHIEEDLQATKDLGLDHYEVRSYIGWYRHITLVMLAYAFLVGLCVQESRPLPAREQPPVALPAQALIKLSTSEVRHLLARPRLGSADLSVVVVAARASILGRLLSSSSSPESRLSPGALRRLGWLALSESAALVSRDLSGENGQEFSREPAPDFPGENSWDKSLQNCRERVPACCRPCHLQHERSCSMTFLALTHCCRLLAIDGKTLRRWLAQAQLPVQAHPSDARCKGLTSDQLLLLARDHHRSLAALPQEWPAPTAPAEIPPELSAELITVLRR